MEQGTSKHRDAPDTRGALALYAILDTPAEVEFDDIVKLASEACGMPVSLISLLDGDRQWFKAETGLGRSETPITASICSYAVQQSDVFVIADTTKDARTAGNPLVTGDPHVRFYAGVSLRTPEGTALGTLCVLDTKPNVLSEKQAFTLRTLARHVMTQLALRRALKERRDSDRRNAAILESAVDYAIVSMDPHGAVTGWTGGAEAILGWSEREMIGRPAHVFFTDQDSRDGIPEKEMGSALLRGRGTDERWHRRKDGSVFWASGEMMPLLKEDGTPDGFIKILRDRTEQRRSEDALIRSEERYRSLYESIDAGFCVIEIEFDGTDRPRDYRFLEVNPAFERHTGLSDPVGRWMRDLAPDHEQHWFDTYGRIARSGTSERFEQRAGALGDKWFEVHAYPVGDAAARTMALLFTDISARKRSERALVASEERWRGLFTGMHEGFFLGEVIRDGDGRPVDARFLEINPAFVAQSGLPADSVGQTIRSLVPDISSWLIETYARTVDTGEPQRFELQVPSLDRWFEVRSHKETGQRFASLFLDITARKQADARRAALAELGDRLRDATDKGVMAASAAEVMGRTLRLSRAGYGAVDLEHETILVTHDWARDDLGSIAALHAFRDYGSYIGDLKAGATVVVDDVLLDPRTKADVDALAAFHIGSLLNLPVIEHGRIVALFYAAKRRAHAWSVEEILFVRNVADRTRAAIARVEAEEQRHVLNLELSHRMKNMLAMVHAIVLQTMRGATDLGVAKKVLTDRVVALSKAHDLLLGGALASTLLGPLIEHALEPHRDRPDRFRLEGPEVKVAGKAATSLSLILHELATNAAKYGALSTAGGRVVIAWTIIGGGDDPQVRLTWTEENGPPVAPPTRLGFGSRLIGRGLAGNFNGSADLSYPLTGVVCTITAPLTGLQAEDTPRPGAA